MNTKVKSGLIILSLLLGSLAFAINTSRFAQVIGGNASTAAKVQEEAWLTPTNSSAQSEQVLIDMLTNLGVVVS